MSIKSAQFWEKRYELTVFPTPGGPEFVVSLASYPESIRLTMQ